MAVCRSSGLHLAGQPAVPRSNSRRPLPRTADGHPDLQGTYDLATLTPLERRPADAAGADRRGGGALEKTSPTGIARRRCRAAADRDAPPKGGDGSTGAARQRRRLQQFLARPRHALHRRRRPEARVAHHRSARRPRAGADAARRSSADARRLRRRPTSDQPPAKTIPASKGPTPTTTRSGVRSASAACSDSARRRDRRCCRPTSTTTCIRSCRRTDTVMILTEMVHDARVVRMNAHAPAEDDPQVAGRFGRPLGGRHARRRHDELHRQDPVPRIEREPPRRRALHAHRREDAALSVHHRGSGDLDQAVDRRIHVAGDRRA